MNSIAFYPEIREKKCNPLEEEFITVGFQVPGIPLIKVNGN